MKLLYTILNPRLSFLLFGELSAHFVLELLLFQKLKVLTVRPQMTNKRRFLCGGQLSDHMLDSEINFLLYVLVFLEIVFIAGGVFISVHNNIGAHASVAKSPKSRHVGSTPCPVSLLVLAVNSLQEAQNERL